MLKPEEVRGSLPSETEIKEHGVSYYALADEYYYDEDGVYHYERMFDKPMDEGGKPFNGVAFETYDDSDQIGFFIEYKDGYQFGNHAGFYENGALSFYTRMDEKEYYTYKWYENGVLKKMTERDIACGKTCGRSREYEWYETGVLQKKTERYQKRGQTCCCRSMEYDETGVLKKRSEWNRKKGQTGCRCREYDGNGKPIRESRD